MGHCGEPSDSRGGHLAQRLPGAGIRFGRGTRRRRGRTRRCRPASARAGAHSGRGPPLGREDATLPGRPGSNAIAAQLLALVGELVRRFTRKHSGRRTRRRHASASSSSRWPRAAACGAPRLRRRERLAASSSGACRVFSGARRGLSCLSARLPRTPALRSLGSTKAASSSSSPPLRPLRLFLDPGSGSAGRSSALLEQPSPRFFVAKSSRGRAGRTMDSWRGAGV